MEIIGVIIAGIVIGVLGKFVAPGRQGQHSDLAHDPVRNRRDPGLVPLHRVRRRRQPWD